MPEIEISHLGVTYLHRKKETTAIRDLSLRIPNEKISVILGASGSGKTTLLMAILNRFAFDGEIRSDGVDIETMELGQRNLAYVSQTFDLYPHFTIYDNLAFPLKTIGASHEEIDERVLEMADFLGLRVCLSRKPKDLSVGQQQRVSLGRALIKRPSLLLLDEPFSNLDVAFRQKMLHLLRDYQISSQITIVYVTHQIKDALWVGDHFIVLEQGTLAFEGDKNALFASPNRSVCSLLEAEEEPI